MNTEQDERLAEIRNVSGDRSLFDHHDMRFVLSQLDARHARIAELEAVSSQNSRLWKKALQRAETAEQERDTYRSDKAGLQVLYDDILTSWAECKGRRDRLAAALAQAEAARDEARAEAIATTGLLFSAAELIKQLCKIAGIDPIPHEHLLDEARAIVAKWSSPAAAEAGETR